MRLRLSVVALLSLALLSGLLYALVRLVVSVSGDSVTQASRLVLSQAAAHVEGDVRDFLQPASFVFQDLRRQLQLKTLTTPEFERHFYAKLHAYPNLSEFTYTQPRWQISVYRTSQDVLVTREVLPSGLLRERERRSGEVFQPGKAWRTIRTDAPDPAEHLTYTTPAELYTEGETAPVWSDLSYSQLDKARRVGVTLQGGLSDDRENFMGVARIGLLTEDLDHAFDDLKDLPQHAQFFATLCDRQGRLITPVHPLPKAPIVEDGDDLRVQKENLPVIVNEALARVAQANATTIEPVRDYLLCIRPLQLENTQDWRVALIVPEASLVGNLPWMREQLIRTSLLVGCLITAGVALLLLLLRRDLSLLAAATRKMRDFQFDEEPVRNALSETYQVGAGLEAAKTTLRAMVKYVPMELVRQLFEARLKPELGSESQTVVLVFSDIAGFTSLAEKMKPDELSATLGGYLETMNGVIQTHNGTVLERVGDALLSLWNAPVPIENGEQHACRAALACQEAIRALPEPEKLQTRFGIHRDQVLVGHFGSRNRLNYGVLGDGVNLASRLEGLNKQYGTTIIVSEAVAQRLGPEFLLRKLDRVAVKGKQQGITIYELVGFTESVSERKKTIVQRYGHAFELYQQRQFEEARQIFATYPDDEPCRIMAERCRERPAENWDGVYRATSK